jgi:hypothetical protein
VDVLCIAGTWLEWMKSSDDCLPNPLPYELWDAWFQADGVHAVTPDDPICQQDSYVLRVHPPAVSSADNRFRLKLSGH